jgi:WD40 repeat protein
VHVLDTATWNQVFALPGPRVRTLSFDPTGPRLATGTFGGDASIWEIPSGARIRHLREIGEPIDGVAFSPDGELVVTASRDGAEQVWNARSGSVQSQFNHHRGKIQSIEFDASSKLVLAAGASGTVTVSDAALGMPVAVLEGPSNVVRVAHFDPTSHLVIGASWDGTARVWDATSPYRHWSSPPVSDDCGIVASLEPDRRFIAVGCRNHATRIWDTARDQLIAELPSVTRVEGNFASAFPAVSAAGDRGAIARDNTVEIYALPGGQLIRTVRHRALVTAVAFGATGHDLVSGSDDGSVLLTRDDREPIALPGSSGGIDAVAMLADGRVVATDAQSRLRVFDADRGAVLADLAAPTRAILLRPSDDGRSLITVPSYTRADPPVLWDFEHYHLIARLEGHVGQVRSARFVRGGREIVTAGGDGTARLWDGSTGALRQTYRGSSRFLADATIAPGGSVVVAGGGDGLLRFWDATTGRPLWNLPAHKSYLVGIHFEGDDIVTRGFAGDVARWTLPKPQSVIGMCDANEVTVAASDACTMMAR